MAGWELGSWGDKKLELSDRLTGMGRFRAPATAEDIRGRQLSTARTIMKNVAGGVISKEEGDTRLHALEGQTQKLLGAAGYGGAGGEGGRSAAEQTAALKDIPKQTGAEFDKALRNGAPIPVVMVTMSEMQPAPESTAVQ